MDCYNTFIIIVLFNAIITCRTYAHKTEDDYRSYSDLNMHSRDGFRKSTTEEIRIVFPTDQVRERPVENNGGHREEHSTEIKGINCTEGICEDAVDYPAQHIRDALKNLSGLSPLFGYLDGTIIDHQTRIRDDEDENENPLCDTTTITKFPRTLTNVANITKYVINIDQYTQGIVVETCTKKAHCGEASFPAGYTARCMQKHSTVKLVAVEKDKSKEPALDTFVIPSCCVCVIKKQNN